MKYLIDTNILLWYINGDEQLPNEFEKIIDNSESEIFISIASLWEITIKVSKGSLVIQDNLDMFFRKNIETAGINILPIELKHLLMLKQLPFIHRDPFDRLIFSQAESENLKFLYTDIIFDNYLSR